MVNEKASQNVTHSSLSVIAPLYRSFLNTEAKSEEIEIRTGNTAGSTEVRSVVGEEEKALLLGDEV